MKIMIEKNQHELEKAWNSYIQTIQDRFDLRVTQDFESAIDSVLRFISSLSDEAIENSDKEESTNSLFQGCLSALTISTFPI